ncbi:hypothetical protein [Herbaspirillum rhizosphaerae]|uniref:hypothetical protein n=1 Tax=Herbaspirillum rhizosphaerae TaxID=346179 RepID=UPI00142F32F7|nr:hypothetical protein [Herbaspirillum rhizosphaerae]
MSAIRILRRTPTVILRSIFSLIVKDADIFSGSYRRRFANDCGLMSKCYAATVTGVLKTGEHEIREHAAMFPEIARADNRSEPS